MNRDFFVTRWHGSISISITTEVIARGFFATKLPESPTFTWTSYRRWVVLLHNHSTSLLLL